MRSVIFLFFVTSSTSCGYYSEQHEPWQHLNFVSEPWDGKPVIEVELVNTASNTAYGPLTVLVVYHDKAGKRIGTERIDWYNVVEPKSNTIIKSPIHPPHLPLQTDSISFEVESARPTNR